MAGVVQLDAAHHPAVVRIHQYVVNVLLTDLGESTHPGPLLQARVTLNGNLVKGIAQTFTWFAEVMADEWNARFLVLVGAAFMHRVGGSQALALWLAKRVSTSRGC